MTVMLPVAEARDQLSRLVADAQTFRERVEISRNGRRAAILLGEDDFDSLIETLQVLADTDLVREIRDGIAEAARGDVVGEDELAARMERLRQPVHA